MTKKCETQIEARARLNDAMEEQAYAQLARSVSSKEQRDSFADDELPLDKAAKTCLKYLQEEPGAVPDGVDDPDERLDWLCRPSSTMRRKIRLEKRWHRRTYGAILAHLDTGEAVALLPWGLSGYYFVNPSTGRKSKVTRIPLRSISAKRRSCSTSRYDHGQVPVFPWTSASSPVNCAGSSSLPQQSLWLLT